LAAWLVIIYHISQGNYIFRHHLLHYRIANLPLFKLKKCSQWQSLQAKSLESKVVAVLALAPWLM
jgi:hypothetical protein